MRSTIAKLNDCVMFVKQIFARSCPKICVRLQTYSTTRGIPAARGGKWSALQVDRVLSRL
jgi:hypothetical protein